MFDTKIIHEGDASLKVQREQLLPAAPAEGGSLERTAGHKQQSGINERGYWSIMGNNP